MHTPEELSPAIDNVSTGHATPAVTLGALKDMLHRFALERRQWSRDDAAAEFGALVLYVIQQADRLDIDLIAAGEMHLREVAAHQPTLVRKA